MPDMKKLVTISTKEPDIARLQDALVKYIQALEAKIKELEARLVAGGL